VFCVWSECTACMRRLYCEHEVSVLCVWNEYVVFLGECVECMEGVSELSVWSECVMYME
jgi:hypothetical protein